MLHRYAHLSVTSVAVTVLFFTAAHAAPLEIAIESIPTDLAMRLVERNLLEQQAAAKLSSPAASYILNVRRWNPGDTVLVAFRGGTPALHKAIAEAAADWTQSVNIKFDFGYDPVRRIYRAWTTDDTAYVAHVRIAFDRPGYWSAIGTDSLYAGPNNEFFPPNEPSMNFAGFDAKWALGPAVAMPTNWKGVVRHEFGHALGFSHEHQQLNCVKALRWTRGPNNEPSVYDVFWAWQQWDAKQVDTNLKANWQGQVDLLSAHDPRSIMHYRIPAEAFISTNSPCFLKQENVTLSALDREGVRRAYGAIGLALPQSVGALAESVQGNASVTELTIPEREAFTGRLRSATLAERPLLYIQIGSEAQRPAASVIQAASKQAGFLAPGIENVAGKAPAQPEVRYFRLQDREYAEAAAKILEANGTQNVRTVRVASLASQVKRNLIEIWLQK